ncbi:hypothetical protein AJ87_14795 [Rhizobium yanglingense]|nr:hypothetical protein AJ87_14795 [Rhizobium yanglingense]
MSHNTLVFRAQDKEHLAIHYPRASGVKILMFPDWEGCETESSHRLARLYGETCDAEVIVTDIYGAKKRPAHYGDVHYFIEEALSDPSRTRSVLKSVFNSLAPIWEGSGPTVVVGFCFGGSLAFETARSGVDCLGAVSIHGQPDTRLPVKSPTGSVPAFLMLHGAEDPFIEGEALNSFGSEMGQVGADWSLYVFGGAKHSFTRADIGAGNRAMGYSQKADGEAVTAVNSFVRRLVSKTRDT